jgi:hypothetical protein
MNTQRYKDMAQLNAKNAYYQMNGQKISNGRAAEENGHHHYGRTESYGLAVRTESKGPGEVQQENTENSNNDMTRHYHRAIVRPSNQVS